MLDANSSKLQHAAQNIALILLSFIFLPLDTFLLFASYCSKLVYTPQAVKHRRHVRSTNTPYFQPRTILVTGVGMSKGLALARLFYTAGHNVIGADFEPAFLPTACGRTSKALKAFHKLQKPDGSKDGQDKYMQSIVSMIQHHKADLWVSCSGVASAVEDGMAAEMVEQTTSCKAVQFNVADTTRLHEKHSFIEHTKSLNLAIPETHTCTSRAAMLKVLEDASASKSSQKNRYIMKYIGTDDAVRGDMTLLPLSSPAATKAHISRFQISESRPWILQQYISGPEFCTHALVIRGEVKAFCACPSSELLMHYEALPAHSGLAQSMLRFTQEHAAAAGPAFTGHCSFDFLVEMGEAEAALKDQTKDVKLYPIECNPRAHTAVVLFNQTPEMADAYLSLLEPKSVVQPASRTPNGTAPPPIYPTAPQKYFWVGHDLLELVLLPLLSLVTLRQDCSLRELVHGLKTFAQHLLFWCDGTYEVWDPLPAWWLYHVYWPVQFAMALVFGKKWSRVNVSTCKMFMC